MRAVFLGFLAFLVPLSASAHPHIFIDTGLEVIFDAEGHASAIRITWTYDELYSLLIIEDRGFDTDYDSVLTPEETAQLQGFDMDWDEGYPGDTYALLGDKPVELGRPSDWTAKYEGGKIVSTHLRKLAVPVDPVAEPLVLQSYDPSFYVAYTIVGAPVLTGRDECAVQVFEPDQEAADAILKSALEELNGSDSIEGEFPPVGAAFSDEARVTCAARS